MFVSSLTIKNYKCFDDHTVRDFNVPDGSPGSELNILIGENGTGKTALLDAINFLTDSSYTIENRISIHDFGDVEEPHRGHLPGLLRPTRTRPPKAKDHPANRSYSPLTPEVCGRPCSASGAGRTLEERAIDE